jgi:hypothetical protein
MKNKFKAGDVVKYKIHVDDSFGKPTDEIIEEGEAEIIKVQRSGGLILNNNSGLIALPEECELVKPIKWHIKMDLVVKDVLGIEYTCVVNSPNSFSIYENNERIAGTTSAENLESHWRKQLSDTLEIIHKQKIQKALSKV